MALQPKTHPTGRGGTRWAGLTAHKRRRSEISERKHLARLWGIISKLAEHKQQQLKTPLQEQQGTFNASGSGLAGPSGTADTPGASVRASAKTIVRRNREILFLKRFVKSYLCRSFI